MFLLLIEHVKLFDNNNMFSAIRHIDIDDVECLEARKNCELFNKRFIKPASALFYTKSVVVYNCICKLVQR